MSLWSTTDKPKYLSQADAAITIGVDPAEAAANNLLAGWTRIKEYTDAQGNPRRKSETLVAMGTIPTDGNVAITDDLTPTPVGTAYVMGTAFTGTVLGGDGAGGGYIRVESTSGAPSFSPAPMDSAFYAALQALTAGTQFTASGVNNGTPFSSVLSFVSLTTSDNTRADIYFTVVSGDQVPFSYSASELTITLA